MTSRQIGEVGIKLIGVYFAASAVHGGAGVLGFVLGSQPEVFLGEMAIANSLPALGDLVVAAVCLFAGGSLARAFFADERLAIAGLSRRDLLVIGVSLLGLSIALAGVPGILQIAATAAWYAEGSRQRMFGAAMAAWWPTLVNSGLALLVGGITAVSAARIASLLDAKGVGSSDSGEPAQ